MDMTEDLAYILGVIDGDGWISRDRTTCRVGLETRDADLASDQMVRKKCPYCGHFFEVYWEQDVRDGYEPDEMNTMIYINRLGKRKATNRG